MARFKKPQWQTAMAESIIIEKRSLKWWSMQTEISERTLAFWAKCYGVTAPYSGEKMIKILSYGYGKAQKAVGSSQDKAAINLQKIERAITWL